MPWPTPPGDRVIYQADGSLVFNWSLSSNLVTASPAQMASLNGHNDSLTGFTTTTWAGNALCYYGIVFPQPRDLKGLFALFQSAKAGTTCEIQTSADTSDGMNGSWAVQAAAVAFNTPGIYATLSSAQSPRLMPQPLMRNIYALSVNGVRGVRVALTDPVDFAWPNTIRLALNALHVYADLQAATASDRLQFWHPTLNQPLRDVDTNAGDSERDIDVVKTFRVKNVSGTLTANGVTLTTGVGTNSGGSPSVFNQFAVSADGNSYVTSMNIGNLAPGAISSLLYARYDLNTTMPLGPYDCHVAAVPTSWT